jgi:hypothetical protein
MKNLDEVSKMATGTQTQTMWAPGIGDLAEMPETHMAEVKHQGELNCGTLNPKTHERLSMSPYTERTSGLPPQRHCHTTTIHPPACQSPPDQPAGTPATIDHRRAPAPPDISPNLPRRCRQTGLDAKRVTPELLRQKFYCSWTGDFFFLFFNCLSCSLFDCPPSLPVNFFGTPFFFSLFLFLFLFFLLSWFC